MLAKQPSTMSSEQAPTTQGTSGDEGPNSTSASKGLQPDKQETEQYGQTSLSSEKIKVVYKLCDINKQMIAAWETHFGDLMPDRIQVYEGDIFRDGPAADAIVSPANSFGFMDGGIDMAYSMHFGWQMQERLQKKIREEHHGELLVGDAVIIPTVADWRIHTIDQAQFNEGQPIKWLVSAPTMRVPMDVRKTANAYLAFRAIILTVNRFNATAETPIKTVLCPGLGTAVGRMAPEMCAIQMRRAYETFVLGMNPEIIHPPDLSVPVIDHRNMIGIGKGYYTTETLKESQKK